MKGLRLGFAVDEVVMVFKEAEGVTLIVRKEWAERVGGWRRVTPYEVT